MLGENNISHSEKYCIPDKITPFIDKLYNQYDVPIMDPDDCDICPAIANLKMEKVNIEENINSKIGGLKKIIDRNKYDTTQYRKCKCYKTDSAKLILSLKSIDCQILRNLEILALEILQCDSCDYLHFDIYSHQLTSNYNMDLFSADDKFYHIINSDDDLNGIIIETTHNIRNINICCKAINYSKINSNIDFEILKVIPKNIIEILNLEFDYHIRKHIPIYLSRDMKI